MMRSMFSGVSGLRVHQTKMDVIGNNIANVNTVGFKSSRVTFNEIFYQTVQGASGANPATGRGGRNPMQIGLGVNVASINTIMTEGAAQRTDNPLDLKIEGDGFFIVSDGAGFKFTRAGAFDIDGAGNLINPEGLKVMGWQVNPTTNEIQKDRVTPITIMTPDKAYSEPAATTKAILSGNIEKTDAQLSSADGVPFTVAFYDNLGYKYTANFSFKKDGATAGDYVISPGTVLDSKGVVVAGTIAPATDVKVKFDISNGKLDALSLKALKLEITGTDTANFPTTGITIDFSQLTLFAGKTSIESFRGDANGTGAGREAGELSGFSVGPDGKIQGRYTNGENRLLGQVATANFSNPAGLEKVGNNLFAATMNSGDFDGIGSDPTEGGGALNAGVLEMSNVDLSKEFTEMITTQRGFQANSRIITSSDEMLQELVNLKR